LDESERGTKFVGNIAEEGGFCPVEFGELRKGKEEKEVSSRAL